VPYRGANTLTLVGTQEVPAIGAPGLGLLAALIGLGGVWMRRSARIS